MQFTDLFVVHYISCSLCLEEKENTYICYYLLQTRAMRIKDAIKDLLLKT